jgi:hypothetical protein
MKKQSMLLFGWLLLAVSAAQAQFTYITTNGTITITGHTGNLNGSLVIPDTINALRVTSIGVNAFEDVDITNVIIPNSVTSIGDFAFYGCYGLTSVTIPNSVTNIGNGAFFYCSGLTNIMVDLLNSAFSSVDGVLFNQNQTTLMEYPGGKVGGYIIPNCVTSIGEGAFEGGSLNSVSISGLTSVSIPNSVSSIGDSAFQSCGMLTSVTIPGSVTNIGDYAFYDCGNLRGVYFQGNAPNAGLAVFEGGFDFDNATVYDLPGTLGWGPIFSKMPTALWTLPYPLILDRNNSSRTFGVQSNQFGFSVSWATNLNVVVEAATELANPIWSPLATNRLSGGSFYFSDPQWTKYPRRFYRVRSR